jgi:hypothetical protein
MDKALRGHQSRYWRHGEEENSALPGNGKAVFQFLTNHLMNELAGIKKRCVDQLIPAGCKRP